MTVDLYHQLGHLYQWNLQAIEEDGAGDGVILAPRYMKRSLVEGLPADIKRAAIFDPQFFLPDQPRGKLLTYGFHPHLVAGGLRRSSFRVLTHRASQSSALSFS